MGDLPRTDRLHHATHYFMERKRGKKYRAAAALLEAGKRYSLEEACALAKKTSPTKFDASVEVHLKLHIDPTQADQTVRSTVSLPHGTGKETRVIAFVTDDKVKEAKTAGAIKAGSEDLIAEIEKGFLDFDVAIATPDMMKKLGKIAKTLGQKGLMPNPKAGTVTTDVTQTIGEIRKGKVEFRNDKQGLIHNMIGRVSFTESQIVENLRVYLKNVLDHKPSGVKGTYVDSITLTTAMGPGIALDVSSTLKAVSQR